MSYRNALLTILFFTFSFKLVAFDTGFLPFNMVKGAIIVEVDIADATYNFVLDTGGYFSVSKEIKALFELSVSSAVTVSDINNTEKVFEKVVVPSIAIGKLVFRDREAIVVNDYDEYPDRCFQISGMIGRDFLKDKVTYFDYENNRMRIVDNATEIPGLREINYTRLKTSKRGLPSVKVEVNGKRQYLEFDSGSSDMISFKTETLEEKLLKGIAESKIRTFEGIFSFGVSGKSYTPTRRYSTALAEWTIGEETFNDFYSDLSKPSAPRIGAGLLPYGIVALDWGDNRFYFEKYDNITIPPEENFGFDIGKIKGEHTVKWIEKGSEAEELGLKYGDVVLGINGQDPAILDECDCYINGYGYEGDPQVELLLRKESGETVSLVMNRQL